MAASRLTVELKAQRLWSLGDVAIPKTDMPSHLQSSWAYVSIYPVSDVSVDAGCLGRPG